MRLISQQRLHELLAYDADAGVFVWLQSRGGVKAGSVAGRLNTTTGYREIRVDGCLYQEHRLAWVHVHGVWPVNDIDHINGVRSDNRISNLRPATRSENHRNRKKSDVNTSGYKGVHWKPATSKWIASIQVNSSMKYLGCFDRIEDAADAYAKAAALHFGEFARIE